MPRPRTLPGLVLLLTVGCLLPGSGTRAVADDEPPAGRPLDAIEAASLLATCRDLAQAARAPLDGSAPAPAGLDGWIERRFAAAGLAPVEAGGALRRPYGPAAGPGAANVLGVLGGSDVDLGQEVLLVGAHVDGTGSDPASAEALRGASGAAVLLHLAQALGAGRVAPRRRIAFVVFGGGRAGAAALAARFPGPGRVVAMLALGRFGRGGASLDVDGLGAYPGWGARLLACLPDALRAQVEFLRPVEADGENGPFHERGVPAFGITAWARSSGPTPSSPLDAQALAAAARLVGALALGLADHPEPLADPLGVARYLVHATPRFAVDDLVARPDGSLGVARGRGHAQRLPGDLSTLVVTVSEDRDPTAAWKLLEDLAAEAGARLVRSVADIEAAHRDGVPTLLPRLCCARAARADPAVLASYAALGYRWIAPWSSGTQPLQEPLDVAPIVEAAKPLKVILDAADLPPDQHAALRASLGGKPALFLTFGPAQGKDLGPLVLPLVRFRRDVTWQQALDACPGMAPPVVYVPKSDRLIEAIAAWGAEQPAVWDEPGSPQRQAIRATLGGRLLEWLARAER